jgi:hypothetical protein
MAPAPTSINGWPVLPRGDRRLATKQIPGTRIRITARREVLPYLVGLAVDYADTIAPLIPGEVGAYNYRPSRVTKAWSNHASATAIDINFSHEGAQRLVNKKWWQRRRTALDALKKKYKLMGWGGDWSDRYYDPMHWELKRGTSVAQVEREIRRLGLENLAPKSPSKRTSHVSDTP